MFKTLANAFKVKELRKKILITLGLLILFRVGCALVCPGFITDKADPNNIFSSIEGQTSGTSFFSLMNLLSGNALSNCSILALGVSPYITASIVIQLLTVAIPRLQNLSRQGEDGRRKIQLYTRICALVLALAQAIGIVISFQASVATLGSIPKWLICSGIVLMLTAGGMFTVWLGEKITQIGVGNGMSLLIFVGIISSSSTAIYNAFREVGQNLNNLWNVIIYLVSLILIFGLIVFIDSAERRVGVKYAKQIKGRKMYGGQDTFIPIKLNASGVMPIIFATSLITLPQLVMSIFWPNSDALRWYQNYMGTSSWLYIVVLALLIFAFAFFYASITFDTDDISRRLQQQGGFIPGIRPGKTTGDYLKKISNRITLFGAMFLAVIALIPSLAFKAIPSNFVLISLVNAFSTTGLMIMVSVALEFDKGLEAQMLMRNYKGFLD